MSQEAPCSFLPLLPSPARPNPAPPAPWKPEAFWNRPSRTAGTMGAMKSPMLQWSCACKELMVSCCTCSSARRPTASSSTSMDVTFVCKRGSKRALTRSSPASTRHGLATSSPSSHRAARLKELPPQWGLSVFRTEHHLPSNLTILTW